VDPLAEIWPEFEKWLVEEPTLTAAELLQRLAITTPNTAITKVQLRTAQRRVSLWRANRAKVLVLGQHVGCVEPITMTELSSTAVAAHTPDLLPAAIGSTTLPPSNLVEHPTG
jgi:hypothetical protein